MRLIMPHIFNLAHASAASRLPAFLIGSGHKHTRTTSPVSCKIQMAKSWVSRDVFWHPHNFAPMASSAVLGDI